MRRAFPILLAITVLSPAAPAHAAGVVACVMTVSLTFTPGVKVTTTSAVDATLSGAGGPCAPVPSLDIPGGLVTTATLGGIATARVAACTAIVATGGYTLEFDDFFTDSVGSFAFVGSAAGGTLTLLDIDSPPRAVGEIALVADPFNLGNAGALAACATSPAGMGELRFVGTLAAVIV